MKKLLLVLVITLAATPLFSQQYLQMIEEGTFPVQEVIENAEAYFADKDKGRGSGYKQFKRWEYDALRMMDDNGYLPSNQSQLDELQRYNAYLNETSSSRQLLNDDWVELGPFSLDATSSWSPGVGRMTGIAVDRSNTDHFITGGLNGGVWQTLDGGQSWTPLSDNFIDLDVNSVTMHPTDSDTYYFGANGGLIYWSQDAGATWSQLAQVGNSAVNKILINPEDPTIMFASVSNSGIFRSADSGQTWTNVTNDGFGFDIEFRPGDVSTVYASGINFHKSIDGGLTFVETDLDGGDTAAFMMGTSENNPDILFALLANGNFRGLYKSTNAGDTWEELDHAGRNYMNASDTGTGTGGQAPRDMDIVVHPDNADQVHIGGVNEWRSDDGGITFNLSANWFLPGAISQDVGYVHADVDYMEYVDGKLYVATDGGVYIANNPEDPISFNYYEDLSTGLGTQQFYKIAAAQSEDATVSGGTQDNGTTVYRESLGDFVGWLGADGGGTGIDIDNPNFIYGTLQFGNIFRSNNRGNSFLNASGQTPGDGPFVTPFESDPTVPGRAYTVTNRVFRTNNFGASYTPISQVFSQGSNLSDVQVSASNSDVIYASRSGFIFKTTDGGATNWEQVTNPQGFVNNMSVHPTNPDLIAAAISGSRRVVVSRDGGESWESFALNLPNFPALTVIWDHNGKEGLYVGMNFGIFYIDNTLDEWIPYSNGLPNVIVNDLAINTVKNELYAGTFGRGLWVSPLVESILSVDELLLSENVQLYPNPATNNVTISLAQNVTGDVRIFNIQGALVHFEKDVQFSNTYSVDVEKLQTGTYFVRLNTEMGTVTKKFIKD